MKTAALALLLLLPQDSEPAPASKATGSALPPAALRALDPDAVQQTSALVRSIYKDVKLEGIEVLLWPGDFLGEKGAALRKKTVGLLEKDGYRCAEETSPQKIEGREVFLCSATKSDRRVYGLWIHSGEAAVLAWGRNPLAAETVFGNVIYEVPKGWTAQTGDAVTLTPGDLLPEEKLFALILPAVAATAGLEDSAEAIWADTCGAFQVDGGKIGRKVDVFTSRKGWTYFRHASEVRPKQGQLFLQLTAIRVGDRIERVAVVTNYVSPPYRESPIDHPRYADALNRMIFGLRFKNHAEPALAEGGLKGDGIVGVWAGVALKTDGQGRAAWSGMTAAFYSNGQVFFSQKLQTFLFEGMPASIACEVTPRWWGTYVFDGGKGSMTMLYGAVPMEMQGDRLVLTTSNTPHRYVKLPPVDGARFDGTYALPEDNGRVPQITFTAEGRFSDQGALAVLEHSLYRLKSDVRKPGEGAYEVKNYSILFKFDDGREFTAACLGQGLKAGDLRPAELVLGFNSDTLRRR